eukprot:CAMPEP_0174265798 /NCGR_PEP_ID=MMETSP0439-20130205/27916_1 /TAXON_ID=0 /ORGANISM="Stereomyxa ramosa, Strain Chinc5" /LENGTH=833 /DNA_ID=CAMNT_0015352429 /DNA_START=119 /DNA_END=2620 /DNA_ORIENTATION=-
MISPPAKRNDYRANVSQLRDLFSTSAPESPPQVVHKSRSTTCIARPNKNVITRLESRHSSDTSPRRRSRSVENRSGFDPRKLRKPPQPPPRNGVDRDKTTDDEEQSEDDNTFRPIVDENEDLNPPNKKDERKSFGSYSDLPPGPGVGAPPVPPKDRGLGGSRPSSPTAQTESYNLSKSRSGPMKTKIQPHSPDTRVTKTISETISVSPSRKRRTSQTPPLSPRTSLEMRSRVIEELISTESDYVRDLNVIYSLYHNPLKELQIISNREFQTIFSNLSIILSVSKEVQDELKLLETAEDAEKLVGKTFLKLADYLKMYTLYCANQGECMKTTAELDQTNKEFTKFLENCILNPLSRGNTLNGFLIKPIQRICKYPLLLKELLKYTPASHDDYELLKAALEKVQKVVEEVEETKNMLENLQTILDIQRNISGINGTLVVPGRESLMSGKLLVNQTGTWSTRFAYLFTDLMIYCKINSSGTAKSLQNRKKRYVFKGAIDLYKADLTDMVDGDVIRNAFTIKKLDGVAGPEQVLFACGSSDEKVRWMSMIRKQIDVYIKSRINRQRDSVENHIDEPPIILPFPDSPADLRENKDLVRRQKNQSIDWGKLVIAGEKARQEHTSPQRKNYLYFDNDSTFPSAEKALTNPKLLRRSVSLSSLVLARDVNKDFILQPTAPKKARKKPKQVPELQKKASKNLSNYGRNKLRAITMAPGGTSPPTKRKKKEKKEDSRREKKKKKKMRRKTAGSAGPKLQRTVSGKEIPPPATGGVHHLSRFMVGLASEDSLLDPRFRNPSPNFISSEEETEEIRSRVSYYTPTTVASATPTTSSSRRKRATDS